MRLECVVTQVSPAFLLAERLKSHFHVVLKDISLYMKELSHAGIQNNFIEAQHDRDNVLRAMLRVSDTREKWPLGMLIDATCPYTQLLFDMVIDGVSISICAHYLGNGSSTSDIEGMPIFMQSAFQYKVFDSMHFWLILLDHLVPVNERGRKAKQMACTLDSYTLKEIDKTFSDVQVLINSEVVFAITRNSSSGYQICFFDIYRVRKGDPLIVTPISRDKNNTNMDMPLCQPRKTLGRLMKTEDGETMTQTNDTKCFILNTPRDFQPTSVRRSNFQGATLTAGTVITEPHLFTEMRDMKMRHIDSWTKINYIIVEDMSLDLNFTLKLHQFNNWGYQTNGSFDGLVGRLQRQELDLGATGMLFKEDRLMVMDYIGETYQFRATLLFRQPSLASVTNIFLQPFSTGVWLCALFMFAITLVALTVEMKIEGEYQRNASKGRKRDNKMKKVTDDCGEVVILVVGAACQQGFYKPPSSLSARITFLALWMASLFLFTSYAANVVALLQTPSHLVQSLSDLLKVPMEVGIQDVIYNHAYFRETTDPLAKELYHKKIEPYHERAYYNAIEGMHRVQKGLFAFQVEHTIGYKIISETFTAEEKCGLGNVKLIRTPLLGIPIVRDSPYKEILSQKLRQLREVGLLDRTWKQWVPQKPSCTNSHHSASRQFVSIGLDELRSSFSLLWAGIIAALSLFFLECLFHKYSRQRKRHIEFRH